MPANRYSYRSATITSTEVALRAGIQLATAATSSRIAGTPTTTFSSTTTTTLLSNPGPNGGGGGYIQPNAQAP